MKNSRVIYLLLAAVLTLDASAQEVITGLTRNRQLKFAASLFGYFEKVHEPEVPEADLALPGRPATAIQR